MVNPAAGLKRVRHFPQAAQNLINDVCFSQPDSKWLLNCSMDGCVRVWDIVTGSLVDWVQFKHAPLSLDFAPSGEYLATSHLNSKAVHLWSNKAFFSQVVIQRVPTKPTLIDLPTSDATRAQKYSHKDFYKDEPKPADETTEPVSRSLVQQKLAALAPVEQAVTVAKAQLLQRSD